MAEIKQSFVSFLIIILSMLVIDGIWLGIMLKRFYAPNIGHILSDSVKMSPAVLFYLLFAIALNVFVVLPALRNNMGYFDLFLLGLLFGLVTYGTYDLTNQAILQGWPWKLTLVDMAWGSLLTGVVSVIATYFTRYFL